MRLLLSFMYSIAQYRLALHFSIRLEALNRKFRFYDLQAVEIQHYYTFIGHNILQGSFMTFEKYGHANSFRLIHGL